MKKTPFRLIVNAYSTTFMIHIAETKEEVASCLALRTQYFKSIKSTFTGLDEDEYDQYCCHLMVTDTKTKQTVGTYRLMRQEVAQQHIGYYGETKFDLCNIKSQQLELVELGRLCTLTKYRDKNIVGMLWHGIYEYLDHYALEYISGSVSLPPDQPDLTSKIYAYAKYKNMLVDPTLLVKPLTTCIDNTFSPDYLIHDIHQTKKEIPKLYLSYLVLNTKICGPSCHDSILNVKEFYILSSIKDRDKNRRINRFKLKKTES